MLNDLVGSSSGSFVVCVCELLFLHKSNVNFQSHLLQ